MMNNLLISKLCHDLITPANALGNGIELMQENNDAMTQKDLIELLQVSSRSLNGLLIMFRACFGSRAQDHVANVGAIKTTATQFLQAKQIQLTVTPSLATHPMALPACRFLIIAADIIPFGGNITMNFKETDNVQIHINGQITKNNLIEIIEAPEMLDSNNVRHAVLTEVMKMATLALDGMDDNNVVINMRG